jgi:hypothetical protein
MRPQWARDIIADCHRYGVAAFHKQWGTYRNNPLVVEGGLSVKAAAASDTQGKGGCLVDGEPVRHYPSLRSRQSKAA